MSTVTLRQNATPKKLSKRQKTDTLISLIFNGKTDMTANAETLGVGRATAYRYWNKWVESEESQQLDMEWWSDYKRLKKKSLVKAFEGLTRLKVRKTVQKVEAKEEITELKEIRLDISVFSNDEKSILDRAAKILDRKMRGESSSIH